MLLKAAIVSAMGSVVMARPAPVWAADLTRRSAPQPGAQCDTPEEQQGVLCQAVCRCDCAGDPYAFSELCEQACAVDLTDHFGPEYVCCGSLPWCEDPTANPTYTSTELDYMQAFGLSYKLDVWTDTADFAENRPLAVYVHGGGFTSGSKGRRGEAERLVDHGFRVIDIDYPLCQDYWTGSTNLPWNSATPLSSTPGYPDNACTNSVAWTNDIFREMGEDAAAGAIARIEIANRAVRTAIQFMHQPERAAEFKIDTSLTICHGGSAGAIACFDAFAFNTTASYDPGTSFALPQDDGLDAVKINVVAGLKGGVSGLVPDDEGVVARAVTVSTRAGMHPQAAAWAVIGEADTVVVPETVISTQAAFDAIGVPMTLHLHPYETHTNLTLTDAEDLEMWAFIDLHLENARNAADDDDDSDGDEDCSADCAIKFVQCFDHLEAMGSSSAARSFDKCRRGIDVQHRVFAASCAAGCAATDAMLAVLD